MAKRTKKIFRHILAQESQANNNKVIKHVKKAIDMLESNKLAMKEINMLRNKKKAIKVVGN